MSDMAMFLSTLGAMVALGGVLYALLRAEFRAQLGADIGGLRSEMRAEFADVRSEMRAEFADVRSEMRTGFADLRSDLRNVETRLSAVEADLRPIVDNLIGKALAD